MKIEWLNEEMSQVRVTRGIWIWKEMAVLVMSKATFYAGFPIGAAINHWSFQETNFFVEESVARKLFRVKEKIRDQRVQASRAGKEWVPVKVTGQLPKAIVNKQD